MYSHVVPYDFNTDNLSDYSLRDIILRHYDFEKWCKAHTEAPYVLENEYNSSGITVRFESADDHQQFMDYAGTYHRIFLHNQLDFLSKRLYNVRINRKMSKEPCIITQQVQTMKAAAQLD